MLRAVLVLLTFIACSPDRPAPIAPAGKAQDFGALFDLFEAEPIDHTKLAKPDSLETPDSLRFHIDLYWEADFPSHGQQAIRDAASRWESVIIRDVQDGPLGDDSHLYPSSIPDETIIDDVAVVVRVVPPDTGPVAFASYGTSRTEADYTQDIGLRIFGFVYLPDVIRDYRSGSGRINTQWEYEFLYVWALHEIGHVLGLVPADFYLSDYEVYEQYPRDFGGYRGLQTNALWAERAPAEVVRDYVPIMAAHWGMSYIDDPDLFIFTNSCMGSLKIQHNDLFDIPLHLYPEDNKMAAQKIITDLDATTLEELGYTVDFSATDPLVVRIGGIVDGFLQVYPEETAAGKVNTHNQVSCLGVIQPQLSIR